MGNAEVRWGISVDEMTKDSWSVGICLSHWVDETYIFINFFKWSMSIGKIAKENDKC